jgi:hypothetical protein
MRIKSISFFCPFNGRYEESMMAKKPAPKRRGGLSAIAHGPKSAAAKHRMEKKEAEKNFPILKQKLDDIKERFKENRAAGRYDYLRSLLEIYSLVWKWDQERKLNDGRLATIAKLRGVALRDNANRFSGIVAYCCDLGERTKKERDRDRKTVSRWSQQLDVAFEQETRPNRLIDFLKEKVASKTTQSKAKKPKPKVTGLRWGTKPSR